MLTKGELLEYKTWPNRYQLEKDYLQYIVLLEIFKRAKAGLVFKGGTALQKCYGLDRFSEDLDFTANSEDEIKRVGESLQALKQLYNSSFKKTEDERSVTFNLRIEGPLFEKQRSIQTIIIEISRREKTLRDPVLIRLISKYRDLEAQLVVVMDKDEIMAEKTRALLTRRRPRDLYDIYFLLKKGAEIDFALIGKKLEYYGVKFDPVLLSARILDLKVIWDKELGILMERPPEFKEIADFVLKSFADAETRHKEQKR
ncbi:nucleotidyl transferase AbiEii/AbiGii toxin family protein [Candidatus Parvarchaeota archaeon]|nr:nucleotidyl transferase AbiEii/AbiGii toxin family protein [Candidatus Parvarchaeota archaeon]